MKCALVCGAGGFIGNHLVSRLKQEGFWVRGVDLKYPEFSQTEADDFVIGDLRDTALCREIVDRRFDEIYQLAADMGGAGYIFTGEHDAAHHAQFGHHQSQRSGCRRASETVSRIFYSSSACMYPAHNQEDTHKPVTSEDSAYPANPDSEYGWEKLFSERLYLAYSRNHGMEVRVARYHNIFGPLGTWQGGREKAPAAICRKVAEARTGVRSKSGATAKQTRSFLYIDECVEGTLRLTRSSFVGPVNIGSEEMVTINQLAALAMSIAGKKLTVRHIPGPTGVRGRNSDNRLIRKTLGWEPKQPLRVGMEKTYQWIEKQLAGLAVVTQ